MADRAFLDMLQGFGLTTAEILYRLPDHPRLVQQFVWQDYDQFPRYPRLIKFLKFWSTNLDGPVERVRVAHKGLITPADFAFVKGELKLQ
jgi:uncharacterized protein Usg